MSLRTRLDNELNRLANQLLGAAGLAFDWVLDGNRLTGRLLAIDALAVSVGELSLIAPTLDHAPLEQLDRIAAALSRQVNYLLEPIRPLERDAEGCVVQLRSQPPQCDDDGTAYYEILARRGVLSLLRYRKVDGSPRESIPAHLTREVFARLASDLVNAVRA